MGVLTQSAQEGVNFQKKIKYSDFTETASATAETIDCFTIPSDAIVQIVAYGLPEEFSGGSNTALTVAIGDDDDADGYVTAKSVLTDETPISSGVNDGAYLNDGTTANTVNGKVYDNSATKTVKAVFTPTGDALTALTAGEILISARIIDLKKEL